MKTYLAVLTLSSLLLGAVASSRNPQAAFYLLPTRAWELGLGAMVATGCFPALTSDRIRGHLASLGLAMILVGLFTITPGDFFPVPAALLPCIGATLLIAYGESSVAGGALSFAPLRWVGRISYSLYLWHWPIITFYRLQTGFNLDLGETMLMVALSFGAASISYYAVERPALGLLRSGDRTWPVLAFGAGAMALLLAMLATISENSISFLKMNPTAVQVASFSDYRSRPDYSAQFRRGLCFQASGDPALEPSKCLVVQPGKQNIVVVGDSHAAQYWRAFATRFPDQNVMQATASGCRPTVEAVGEDRCVKVMNYVFGTLVPKGGIDTVVLAGRWQSDDLSRLMETVRYLHERGVKVLLIGPTVEYQSEVPSALARAIIQGHVDNVQSLRLDDREAMDRKMALMFAEEPVTFVSVYRIECPQTKCRLFAPDGGPMQFDYGHLTLSGAQWVVSQMPSIG